MWRGGLGFSEVVTHFDCLIDEEWIDIKRECLDVDSIDLNGLDDRRCSAS